MADVNNIKFPLLAPSWLSSSIGYYFCGFRLNALSASGHRASTVGMTVNDELEILRKEQDAS
jgi:hypothetical protein